ncbi:MAG: hypothetical protein JWO95_1343 [Verrucomicrobiales bacterium]|nr:hypothetical protein [Verrucomicrobiales bacterium]
MKRQLLVLGIWIFSGAWSLVFGASTLNTLTDAEKTAGWKLLFDGKTFDGWRCFRSQTVLSNWVVSDGCLHHLPIKNMFRDLITDATFDDFELEWDWKIAPKANSGVKYFITEDGKSPIGFEYQMVDDQNWDPKHPQFETVHGTGSLYDVLRPKGVHTSAVGEFNHSRIVVSGQRIEHWLNGEKVVETDLGSTKLKSAIARSKFKDVPRFGEHKRGHILLQDHNDEVWFKNIKIRSTTNEGRSTTK